MLCNYCNKNFETVEEYKEHYITEHNYTISLINKKIKLGDNFPKCPICGKDVSFKGNRLYLNKTCGDKNCIKELYRKEIKIYYKNNPQAIENKRRCRINYLKNKQNFEKTAWGLRAYGKLSYLEQWF